MSERRKARMADYLKIYDEAYNVHVNGTNYTNLNQSHEFALKVLEIEINNFKTKGIK